MNPLRYFWNNPYPESIMWPVVQGFRKLSSHMEEKPISDRRYRVQCVVISLITFVALFLLTGTKNPLEFFIDIPIYNLAEFNRSVGGDEYALFIYMFSSAILISISIYLVRLFLFNAKEESFFTVNGLFFFVMTVFISAVVDVPVKKIAYAFSVSTLLEIEAMDIVGLILLGLALNFTLYFVMQDSFTAILSSAISVELIMLFQKWFQQFITNRMALILIVSLLMRIFLELLDKIGAWRPIVAFCAKWFYTPKYIIKLAFCYILIPLLIISGGVHKKKKL